MRIFYYFIERRILLSQIIFVLFLILSLHSCKKSSSGFINPDIHFQAFENKWKLYNKSTNGGWKNNFNGRYSWDDAYALEGLLMHYQRSSDKRYVDTFIKVASRILETSDDDLKINDKYRGNKIVKGWSSKRYTVDSSYHVFGITNAMILYPVVKLFNILQDKNEIIQENISFFNKFKLFFIDEFNNIQVNDWVNLSSESGYFQDPYYSGLGIITPVNQYSRIGSYAIELYKLTGDLKYLVYAKKVARHLKNNLIQFSSYYYWNYIITSQPSPSDKPEDLGHSILVIQFIVNCYKNNIIFDQNVPVVTNTTMNTMTALQYPQSIFATEDQNICETSCISFLNQSESGTSYSWTFAGGNPASSTSASPGLICYSTAGNYDVTLITTNALGSDTLIQPAFISVATSPGVFSIVQSGDSLVAPQGYDSYQWYYNNNPISGDTLYYHVATQNGDYGVVVGNANGCESGVNISNVIIGVEYLTSGKIIDVYPNPSNGNFEITFDAVSSDMIVVSVIDKVGKIVFEKEVLVNSGSNKIKVSEYNFTSGVYLLKLSNDKGVVSKRLVINK